MKVAILTNAYHEERWIEGCIRQFQPSGLDHLVLNSASPWCGEKSELKDTTDIIAKLNNAEVIRMNWKTEADQFNFGMGYLADYDWILIVDADERYTKRDIDNFLKYLSVLSPSCQYVRPFDWTVYWKNYSGEIYPTQPFTPIIAVRPTVTWKKARSLNNEGNLDCSYAPVWLYHFSYVRTNEEMLRKINSFSHSDEIIPGWYKYIWLGDTEINLHPVVPEQFQKVLTRNCPQELLEYLP